MNDSHILPLIAERLGGKQFGTHEKIYKFERIKRAKKIAQKTYPQSTLLDFGVGEPDRMADPLVVETLSRKHAKKKTASTPTTVA